jgi:hypothetical protein
MGIPKNLKDAVQTFGKKVSKSRSVQVLQVMRIGRVSSGIAGGSGVARISVVGWGFEEPRWREPRRPLFWGCGCCGGRDMATRHASGGQATSLCAHTRTRSAEWDGGVA